MVEYEWKVIYWIVMLRESRYKANYKEDAAASIVQDNLFKKAK